MVSGGSKGVEEGPGRAQVGPQQEAWLGIKSEAGEGDGQPPSGVPARSKRLRPRAASKALLSLPFKIPALETQGHNRCPAQTQPRTGIKRMARAPQPCSLGLLSSRREHTQHGSWHPGHTQRMLPAFLPGTGGGVEPSPDTGLPPKTNPTHRQQRKIYWRFLRNLKGKFPSRARLPENPTSHCSSFSRSCFPEATASHLLSSATPAAPLLALKIPVGL